MRIEGQRAPNTPFKIKLLFATAYITNRTPHSALIMGAQYGLHGMEATLQHLRPIGSRASKNIETRTQEAGGQVV